MTNAAEQGFRDPPDHPMDTGIHYYTAKEFTVAHKLGLKTKIVWCRGWHWQWQLRAGHIAAVPGEVEKKISCRLRFIAITKK